MANIGLLGGLGEALRSGVGAYQDQTRYNNDQARLAQQDAMQKKMYQMNVMQSGLQENPEGDFSKTPEAQENEVLAHAGKEAEIGNKGFLIDKDKTGHITGIHKDPNYKGDLDTILKQLQIKKELQGEKVPASQVIEQSFAPSAYKSLEDIKSLAKDNPGFFGGNTQGLIGSIKGALQVGEEGKQVRNIDSQLKSRAQIIGKYLEGGKLTDQDIARYADMLPKRGDDPQVVNAKVDNLQRLISVKQSAETAGLKGAGYNVGNLPMVPNTPNIPKINSKQGAGLIPQANAGSGPKPGMVEDGYQFKGGDPSSPQSWVKVK